MTDSTKQLFDAPWGVHHAENGDFYLYCNERHIAVVETESDANRLARLPELYDALEDAAERVYKKCVAFWFPGQKFDFPQNFADFICPITKAGCFCENWLNLLRKVRDVE